ncbi:UdgX family uracil-DNA binding protein [Inquilinus sp.]|jgi:uracil-DNA glycosylase family protein|uniref:UdgX family uracil-DNA binding protein n=1 Tax=Inquilinus sp. TaxID=1932117 RepID=UPI00378446B7
MESLQDLVAEARGCTRCPLHKAATQTVFGEGPADAAIVFVGEQPGDQEDRQGRPFVGPAGRIFDQALAEAGIPRDRVYITNAVKHFKFAPRGKHRLHKRPNAGEIDRCRWWLDRELAMIRPRLTVALGATAARSLAGRPLAIGKTRGRLLDLAPDLPGLVTVHPSSLLRVPDPDAKRLAYAAFVKDLAVAADALTLEG